GLVGILAPTSSVSRPAGRLTRRAALASVGHQVAIVVDVELVRDAIGVRIRAGGAATSCGTRYQSEVSRAERPASSCAGSHAAVDRAPRREVADARIAV